MTQPKTWVVRPLLKVVLLVLAAGNASVVVLPKASSNSNSRRWTLQLPLHGQLRPLALTMPAQGRREAQVLRALLLQQRRQRLWTPLRLVQQLPRLHHAAPLAG